MAAGREHRGSPRRAADLDRIALGLRSPVLQEVRDAIAACLNTDDPRVLPELKRFMVHGSDVSLRYIARKTFHEIQARLAQRYPTFSARSESFLPDGLDLAKLEQDLADERPAVRIRASQACASFLDDRGLPLIKGRLKVETDADVKACLVLTLGRLGSDSDLMDIGQYLRDPDPRVRANAVEGLQWVDHPAAGALVIQCLRDEDNRVRANALLTLNRLGASAVLMIAEEMLATTSPAMRTSAAFALGHLGPRPDVIRLLVRCLEDQHAPARAQARASLEHLASQGDEAARKILEITEKQVEALTPAMLSGWLKEDAEAKKVTRELNSRTFETRLEALRQIHRRKDPSNASLVSKRLAREKDPFVLSYALQVLGDLAGASAADVIASFVAHANPRVRANAIEVLGRLQDRKTIEPLRSRLRDDNPRARANAIIALARFDAVDVAAELRAMLSSPEEACLVSALFVVGCLGRADLRDELVPHLRSPHPRVREAVWKLLLAADAHPRFRELREALEQSFAMRLPFPLADRFRREREQSFSRSGLRRLCDEVAAFMFAAVLADPHAVRSVHELILQAGARVAGRPALLVTEVCRIHAAVAPGSRDSGSSAPELLLPLLEDLYPGSSEFGATTVAEFDQRRHRGLSALYATLAALASRPEDCLVVSTTVAPANFALLRAEPQPGDLPEHRLVPGLPYWLDLDAGGCADVSLIYRFDDGAWSAQGFLSSCGFLDVLAQLDLAPQTALQVCSAPGPDAGQPGSDSAPVPPLLVPLLERARTEGLSGYLQVTGPPGSGRSSLAALLVARFGACCYPLTVDGHNDDPRLLASALWRWAQERGAIPASETIPAELLLPLPAPTFWDQVLRRLVKAQGGHCLIVVDGLTFSDRWGSHRSIVDSLPRTLPAGAMIAVLTDPGLELPAELLARFEMPPLRDAAARALAAQASRDAGLSAAYVEQVLSVSGGRPGTLLCWLKDAGSASWTLSGLPRTLELQYERLMSDLAWDGDPAVLCRTIAGWASGDAMPSVLECVRSLGGLRAYGAARSVRGWLQHVRGPEGDRCLLTYLLFHAGEPSKGSLLAREVQR